MNGSDRHIDEKFADLDERLAELGRLLKQIEHHLSGNGKPESGMMFRLSWVEQKFKQIVWIAGIVAGVCATITGSVIVIVITRAIESGAK